MKNYQYVILGGGVVAGYAAQVFVEWGVAPHELCILSAEKQLPYARPPLSKDFLLGKAHCADLLINPPDFYTAHAIDVQLATPVVRVDFANKRLHTSSESIGYSKLLIATGSTVRPLTMPAADLAGIYYLRGIEDAKQLQHAAQTATQAVVIGGSFIGMEVAAVLQQQGIATTLLFPQAHLGARLFTTRMATFFEKYYCARGVTIRPQSKVIGFHGDAGQVTHVSLASGQDLPTDLVVAGIGVSPNLALFAQSELLLDDGILVNHWLETNIPDVYAAGDVARYPDRLFADKLRRVEHWDNAVTQAKYAAQTMLGQRTEFIHVPYFFSDCFDLSYEFWGDPEAAETIVYRGEVDTGAFSVWWLSPSGRLLAAFVMHRPAEEQTLAPQWIKAGTQLDGARLGDSYQTLQTAVA